MRVPFNRPRPKSSPIVTPSSASPESSKGGIATPDGRSALHQRQAAATDEGDRIARQFEADKRASGTATRPRRS